MTTLALVRPSIYAAESVHVCRYMTRFPSTEQFHLNTGALRRPGQHQAVPRRHNDAQRGRECNTQQSRSAFRHSDQTSSWSAPASCFRIPSLTLRRPNGGLAAARKENPGKSKSNGDTAVRQAEAAAEGPSHASHLPYCLVAGLHILHTSRQS
jgi:hypothetical protein